MGAQLDIYYLFKINDADHILIRVIRPGYSNASQTQSDWADQTADLKKEKLLELYLHSISHDSKPTVELIGEFQGLPDGDELYAKNGIPFLSNLWYIETTYGHPWIYLTLAENETEFWSITDEDDFADNGYTREHLIDNPIKLESVRFITENDFDLSSVPNYNKLDFGE